MSIDLDYSRGPLFGKSVTSPLHVQDDSGEARMAALRENEAAYRAALRPNG